MSLLSRHTGHVLTLHLLHVLDGIVLHFWPDINLVLAMVLGGRYRPEETYSCCGLSKGSRRQQVLAAHTLHVKLVCES